MKDAKYTPGPWDHVVKMNGFTAVGGTTLIARVFSTAFRDDSNEAANAQLVSAAPNLLEACEIASEVLEPSDLGYYVIKNAVDLAKGQA